MPSFLQSLLPSPTESPCLLDAAGQCLHTYASLTQAITERSTSLQNAGPPSGILAIPRENSPEFIINALAGLEAGFSILPSATNSTATAYLSWDTQADLFPVSSDSHGLPGPCFLRWTSGSVSDPKLAAISLDAIEARIKRAATATGLTASDRILWFMPMADHFLVSILLYLHVGASIVLLPSTSLSPAHSDGLQTVSTLYGLPFHLSQFLSTLPDHRWLPSLKQIFCGGEAIPFSLYHRYHEATGLWISPFWGVIEAGIPTLGQAAAPVHPGKVGPSCDGFTITPAHPGASETHPQPLYVASPGLFSGYLTSAGFEQREDLPTGWPSGDCGFLQNDGEWVLSGRTHQAFSWNGRSWTPQEVEALLLRHPAIEACRLHYGSLPAVEVDYAAISGTLPPKPSEMQVFCSSNSTHDLSGLQFHPVATLPRHPSGKVNRNT